MLRAHGSVHRVAAWCVALAACLLLAPAVAEAAPSLAVSGVDYSAGTITLRATFETPTAEVRLFAGAEAAEVTAAVSPTSVDFQPRRLTETTVFSAYGYDALGVQLWAAEVAEDPGDLRPEYAESRTRCRTRS